MFNWEQDCIFIFHHVHIFVTCTFFISTNLFSGVFMPHRAVFIIVVCVVYFPYYKCRTAVCSLRTIFLGEGRTPCAVKQYIVFSWSSSDLKRSDEDLCFCYLVLEQIFPNNCVSRQWVGAFPQQTITSWKLNCFKKSRQKKLSVHRGPLSQS